jgi:dTDP-4-dehydrorhamnose 3,5-epimerase
MLPAGVELRLLEPHADERGVFTELFRDSWDIGVTPAQWNVVRSQQNVLRGIHAH